MSKQKTPTLEEAKEYIYSIDFSRMIDKMVNHMGWLRSDAEEVCEMYRNFLYLNKKYPQFELPPSEDIDQFWHMHILDTVNYRKDCLAIFGKYLHHYPYSGIDGKSDMKQLEDAYKHMLELYAKEFDGAKVYQIRGTYSKICGFFKNIFRGKTKRIGLTKEQIEQVRQESELARRGEHLYNFEKAGVESIEESDEAESMSNDNKQSGQVNKSEKQYLYMGLTRDDILYVLKDRFVRKLIKQFHPNHTFQIIRGFGFVFAILAGLFGYYLTWDSEKDDRRAEIIRERISEKVKWMRQVDAAVMGVRKARYLITLNCKYKKPPTTYDQNLLRFNARHNLVKAFTGIEEIYDRKINETFVNLVAFDESVKDVCARGAPGDKEWWKYLHQANHLMRQSIDSDRARLNLLGQGVLNKVQELI